MRTEKDFLGEKQLDDRALYGLQTARAADNFGEVSGYVSWDLIDAMVTVKKAAAMAYRKLEADQARVWDSLVLACDRILEGGEASFRDQFPTAALQGGAGTSTNMNVNEVLANLALSILGLPAGRYDVVHPLDTVNKGQSTNDVYPTALRIAAIRRLRSLSDACAALQESLQRKEQAFDRIRKLGRTEMMDAMEVRLGEEFGSYAQAVGRDRWRLYKVEERLRQVSLGGTAVGTGTNAGRKYGFLVMETLRDLTGIGLAKAEYPMDPTQNQDVFVEVSGLLKAMAVNLMKITADLRLMASGPRGGFGELALPPLQKGSTIMPGKVNPVIPELVAQASIRVIAHDLEITTAASLGSLELNAFLPLIADAALDSLGLLTDAAGRLCRLCVDGITANEDNCLRHLLAADTDSALEAPVIGYDAAEQSAREKNLGKSLS